MMKTGEAPAPGGGAGGPRAVNLATDALDVPSWVGSASSEELTVTKPHVMGTLQDRVPESLVDARVAALAESLAATCAELCKGLRVSSEKQVALGRDLLDMVYTRFRTSMALTGHLGAAKGLRRLVRPCSMELDGQLSVYPSEVKGNVLVQLSLSEDRAGYHVRPPEGHDVITEFKALQGLVTGVAPSWTCPSATMEGMDVNVMPGDVVVATDGTYKVLQILVVPGLPGKAVLRSAVLIPADGDGPCYATAGRVELLPLAKLVQKLPAVTINGKAVVSPSCRSRFMQCTGAVADAFLKAVHSKGQAGEVVLDVPMSRQDFTEFILPAGTQHEVAAMVGRPQRRGAVGPVGKVSSKGAEEGGEENGAGTEPNSDGGGSSSGKPRVVHLTVTPEQYPRFRAMVMAPGGFPGFPERLATASPRRAQKRLFVSTVRGPIEMMFQPSQVDRDSPDSEDSATRTKGTTCADRLLIRFKWYQDLSLV